MENLQHLRECPYLVFRQKSYRIVMLHEVTMIAVCSVEMVIIGHQAPQMSFKNIQKDVFIIFHTQRKESYKVPSGYEGCLRPKIFRTRLGYYTVKIRLDDLVMLFLLMLDGVLNIFSLKMTKFKKLF